MGLMVRRGKAKFGLENTDFVKVDRLIIVFSNFDKPRFGSCTPSRIAVTSTRLTFTHYPLQTSLNLPNSINTPLFTEIISIPLKIRSIQKTNPEKLDIPRCSQFPDYSVGNLRCAYRLAGIPGLKS